MKFTPDPIDLPRTDARLRIVNDGAVPHSFIVPELGKGTPDLEAGAEMTLDLTEVPAGTYTVICDIPGHREAGMETTLTLR
jgi:plastocyanin